MRVCIVDTERSRPRQYQIMVNTGTLFEHVFPGKLFTLNEAIKICEQNSYEIQAIGSMWHCLNK